MTSRSSIFSFDTLRLPLTAPRGLLFALALLGVAELTTRGLLARGKLEADPSLHRTIASRVDEIDRVKPQLWLLGNSTLDWGVDGDVLSGLLGEKLVKLPHGSATLGASAALLQLYIDTTHQKPQRVIVTLTKDDLNANGSRAEISRTYLDLARTDRLPPGDWLALREARSNIRDAAVNLLHRGRAATQPAPVKSYDGTPLPPDNRFNSDLLRNFKLDTAGFAALKAVCDRNGLPPAVIVLMPVTDQYGAFHDRMVAAPKYDAIHAQVLAAVAANGMACLDYWATPRTDYVHFRDAYHLTPSGEALFTRQLADALRPVLAHPTTAE